jgi:predicted small metal-binding protein
MAHRTNIYLQRRYRSSACNAFILWCATTSMKKLSCRDAGFDCDYTMEGYTEQELFRNGQKHVFNIHGMRMEEFTPQFNERIRPLIRD